MFHLTMGTGILNLESIKLTGYFTSVLGSSLAAIKASAIKRSVVTVIQLMWMEERFTLTAIESSGDDLILHVVTEELQWGPTEDNHTLIWCPGLHLQVDSINVLFTVSEK